MREVVLVCGYGRCGSSMVMQMLAAGGLPCVGRAPAYEDQRAYGSHIDAAWMATLQGQAVKVLDPHVSVPPPGLPYKVIWLDRLPKEQGKSQVKFLRLTMGLHHLTRADVAHFAASYRADRPHVEAVFRRLGAPVLRLRFEAILRNPKRAALEIIGHLGTALDADAMAAAVIARPQQCARGLEIETALIARAMEQEAAHV